MKESGLETASSRNIWGVLTLISTIVAILIIFILLLLDNIVVPQDHPCYALHRMLCDFYDDFFEIISISPLFLFIASVFLGAKALECRYDQNIENEAKKRDEKQKKQKAEAKKLQAKLDKMIKERSSDKT